MPLDENLPTFFLSKTSADNEHRSTFYLTRSGSEPEPAYSLHHAEPAASKNCYAVALYDAYNSDVLFGEVLLRPQWTHSTLSQEDVRKNGGVPPPPEPVMPHEFTVQLYNPDQQIVVTHKHAALLGSTKWEFSMPQDTFRAPSGSILDLSRSDPGAATTTPRINFALKKEKFSKEIACYMTGKSTDVLIKKRNKEPDIIVSIFKSLKELTIYEPNLYRVEMEDPKGLEVVLLLITAVIRDVFFGNMKQAFNISEGVRAGMTSPLIPAPTLPLMSGALKSNSAAVGALYQRAGAQSPPSNLQFLSASRPPPADPLTEWQLEAETARIRAQTEAEDRERLRVEDLRRRERERQDQEETLRLRRMVEQEERDRREKQKQIDRETEHLRQIYGQQPELPPRSSSGPPLQAYQSTPPPGAFPTQSWNGYGQPGPMMRPPPIMPPHLYPTGFYAQQAPFNINTSHMAPGPSSGHSGRR